MAELPSGPLDYHEAGPADGPPALLVHGVIAAAEVWSRVEVALARRGWRVVTPTLPLGAHQRAMPAADVSPRGVAGLLTELVEHLGLAGVTLVGNDTGGALCQFAIDRDPEPFAGLVLTNCDAFTTFPPRPFGVLRWIGRHPRLLETLYAPMRSARVRRAAYAVLARDPLPEAMTAGWWEAYAADAGVRHDAQRFLAAIDPRELDAVTRRMSRFDRPVTVCWATQDRVFGEALGRRLHGVFPRATFVPVTASRAFVMWDRPDAVVESIAALRLV